MGRHAPSVGWGRKAAEQGHLLGHCIVNPRVFSRYRFGDWKRIGSIKCCATYLRIIYPETEVEVN